MTKQEFFMTIPLMEQIYVLYSNYTKCAYVNCDNEECEDEVLMFSSEELANIKIKELEEKKILCRPCIVSKDQSRDYFYELSVFYGVNRVIFQTETETFSFLIEEIIKKPDFVNLPENLRPLRNPQLQLSMMYFMQEARKDIPKEERDDDMLVDLQEEMMVNLARSLYLLPCLIEEVDGKEQMKLVLMSMSDGAKMVPVVADSVSFAHFVGRRPKAGIKAMTVDIEKLAALELPEEATGFIVNPQDVNVPLPRDFVVRLAR